MPLPIAIETGEMPVLTKETYLFVGLGNPGLKYDRSRHNCGFQVIRRLSDRWQTPLTRHRLKGLLGETRRGAYNIVLCQPQTMMNLSGECVQELLHWYKCPLDHLVVIYDDIDLPLGTTRMRKAGNAGTHNGMRSILGCISDPGFPRIRVGIGNPPEGWDLVDWVLGSPLSREEAALLDAAFDRAADACEDLLAHGMDHAMELCNRRVSPSPA